MNMRVFLLAAFLMSNVALAEVVDLPPVGTTNSRTVARCYANPLARLEVQPDTLVNTNKVISHTSAACVTDTINVMDAPYDAKGDGANDDTSSIQGAVLAAEARLNTSNYWSQTSLPGVYLPPGNYMVSGIDVHRPIRFYSDGPGAATLTLIAGSNRSILRSIAEPQTDPLPWAQTSQPTFSGFSINGNGSTQTGISSGIEIADAPYLQGMRYGSGARIRDVNVLGTLSHGIYVGQNRNLGFIDNVIVNYAQQSCVYFNGVNDWEVSNSSLGACTGNGIGMYYSGAITIFGDAIYNNGGDGILVGPGFGSYLWITGGTIGANGSHGVEISQTTLSTSGVIGMSNVHMTDNSLEADNAKSHISVRKFSNLMLSNVWFYYQGSGNNAKYLIDNDTSAYIAVSNLVYSTAFGSTPYATSAFANPTFIVGASNPMSGTFGLNVPLALARGGKITSANQYDGFAISNGANTVAILQGTGVTNDGGTLGLYNGGTQQVRLSATTQSAINQGLMVGNNLTSTGSFAARRVGVSDVAYTVQSYDYEIAYTSLTATRAVTLPCTTTGSSATPKFFIIKDESGQAGIFPLTLIGNVDGSTNKAISTAYGQARVYANGAACFTW